jgi:hypothetical protein
MDQKRELDAKDLIYDIRAGMTDFQLMEKYRLSDIGLQSAFKKLLHRQAISPEELCERFPLYEVMTVEDMRSIVRSPLRQPLPIYDATRPEEKGLVRNITQQGVGVEGIFTRVNDIKTFMLDATGVASVGPIRFSAQCRWVKKRPSGEYVAGFEIMKISPRSVAELRKLLAAITDQDPSSDPQ